MLYLSQMIGEPVVDAQGERLGTISDLAISTGEVFPRITSLAFQGPGRVPFMISWRKYVDTFDDDGITLSVDAHDIRFSYLQPDEVLLARDLMDRQIVDTQGLKVVRVNDLKLSDTSSSQLRLLGAEDLANRCYRELSGGQQQRVLLARALCAAGRLLLMDEPFTGLDPTVTNELYDVVDKLNHEQGVTVIMVTHDVPEALRHASRILHLGAEHFDGTAEEYRQSPLYRRLMGGDLNA